MKRFIKTKNWSFLSIVCCSMLLFSCKQEIPIIHRDMPNPIPEEPVNPTPVPPEPAPTPKPTPKPVEQPRFIEFGIDTEGGVLDNSKMPFITKYGGQGDIQYENAEKFELKKGQNTLTIPLKLYGRENTILMGWSWRYADDPVKTHRNSSGQIVNDFIKTPVIQFNSGYKVILNTHINCEYRKKRITKFF